MNKENIFNQDPEMQKILEEFAMDMLVSGLYNLYFSVEDHKTIKNYLSTVYSGFDAEKFEKDTRVIEIDVDTDPRVKLGDVTIVGTSETTLAVVAKINSSYETVMECDIPEDISKIHIFNQKPYWPHIVACEMRRNEQNRNK